MSDTPRFTDGTLHEKEISTRPRLDFPFARNPGAPDVHARVFKRQFSVSPASYLPRLPNRSSYTNDLSYSNDFANAAWAKTGVTIGSDYIPNPWDGATTVDYLAETTANSAHHISRTFTAFALPYVVWLTVAVPLGASRYLVLEVVDSAAVARNIFFNSVSRQLTSFSGTLGVDAFCEALPRTYSAEKAHYLIGFKFTPAAGTATLKVGFSSDGVLTSYIGSASGSAYVGNVQIELGASLPGPLIINSSSGRTVSLPEIDLLYNASSFGGDRFALMVDETQPPNLNTRRGIVERTYARIPRQQIVPDSKFFNRPALHDVKSGTNYGVCFDAARDKSWIFGSSERKTISSIGAITLGTVPVDAAAEDLGTLPSTNFVMIDSSGSSMTLPINYGADNLQGAMITTFSPYLSAITGRGTPSSVTLEWINNTRSIASITTTDANVTMSATGTSVTFTAKRPAATAADTQKPNQNPSVRTINATAHGGVVGDKVVFWQGDSVVAMSVVYSVPTADSFTVPLKDVDGKDLTLTHCGFSSDAALCVLNGPKTCSCQRITDFYLPGYTEGISTAADIPAQDPATDAVNWLAAIIAGTTWVNIDGSELKSFQGPILQREYTQVQLADAVVTVTP